jgi:hypothetical protein
MRLVVPAASHLGLDELAEVLHPLLVIPVGQEAAGLPHQHRELGALVLSAVALQTSNTSEADQSDQ